MKKLFLIIFIILVWETHAQSIDSLSFLPFLDGVIQSKLTDRGLAGATMSFVKDGRIVAVRGYGYSDIENHIPVDPHRTLFRIGSISKTFIWTALMQLYSEGKLSLDDPVDKYLPELGLSAGDGEKPIRILDLMNHTAGFEDRVIGLFSRMPEDVKPMSELLKAEPPARVRPTATHASYSNYGAGVAARLVEVISGKEWNDYVEQKILQPTGMRRTTFRQPVSASLAPMVSKGYSSEAGQLVEQPFEYVPMTAIGGASSTAADMARYMIMHLQSGMIDSVVVLENTTAKMMQQPSLRHHPSVNPMRHGFMDFSQNEVTIIGHGGDTFWFHSLMAIFPRRNMGIFISFNTAEANADISSIVYTAVLADLVDSMFPEKAPNQNRVEDSELEKYAGEYEMNRYPHSSIVKVMKLGMVAKVYPKDGLLAMNMGGNESLWSSIGNDTFKSIESSEVIAFSGNENGMKNLYIGLYPIFVLDRISAIDSPGIQALIFVITLIFMLTTLIFWPFAYMVRRGYREQRPQKLPLAAKFLAWFNAFFYIIFFILLGIGLSNPVEIVYGVPGIIRFALVLPFLNVVLLLLMGFMAAWIWRENYSNRWSRIYYYSLVITFAVAIWQLNYWNLLGWNY